MASSTDGYALLKTISLPGNLGGHGDIVAYDSETATIWVAQSPDNNVVVIDTTTNTIKATIPNIGNANGIALTPQYAFVADVTNNMTDVIDKHTFQVVARVPQSGTTPDGVVYVPSTNQVLVASDDNNLEDFLNATAPFAQTASLQLQPNPAVTGPDVALYVPTKDLVYQPDDRQVDVINPHTGAIVATWNLLATGSVKPMVYDPNTNHFLIGTTNNQLLVVDGDSGAVLKTIAISGSVDQASIDVSARVAFFGDKAGVADIVNLDTGQLVGGLPAEKNMHTLAVDTSTHDVYVYENNRNTIDVFAPAAGSHFVVGTAPTQILAPDPGHNVLDGRPGASDTIAGGSGIDTVSYASAAAAVSIDLGAQLTWDGSHNDTLSSIENATGSKFNDTIVGDGGNNVFDGGGGADHISGGGGSDTVSFASAASAVSIDLGAQLTWDGSHNDTLSSIENAIGSKFNDTIVGDDGNNVFDGGGGADHITGGGGSDTVSFASSASALSIDLGAQLSWDGTNNDTLSSIENAIGSKFNDTIVGNDGNNVFDGGGGADHISGGLGSDTISFASSASAASIDLSAQLTWDGTNNDTLSSIENAIGSKFNDTIVGDDGNNVLDGGAGGADHIDGRGGVDTVSYASSASGVVIDLAAQLTWDGTNNDTLASIENAIGSTHDDILVANTAGVSNVMTGGLGSDTFAFRPGFGHDAITDFAASGTAHDVMELGHGLFANDDPLAAAHDVGNDVVLVANDHEDITLLGLHKADLAMTDFHFV